MKLLIIGDARHGKDSVAALIRDRYGLQFTSSSMALLNEVVIPHMAALGLTYETPEAAYADRVNHRAEWFNAIAAYNTPDRTRLFRFIISRWDMYVGLRNPREFHAARNEGLFDYSLWVDGSARLPREDRSSMGLEPWMADFIIDNNGSEDELPLAVYGLCDRIISGQRTIANG